MDQYEYRVVPAPTRGKRAKGVRGLEARFAHALQCLMNELAADGWEYLRTDTLPSEERIGLTGKNTIFQNVLVFKRPKAHATRDMLLLEHQAAPPPLRAEDILAKAAPDDAEDDDLIEVELVEQNGVVTHIAERRPTPPATHAADEPDFDEDPEAANAPESVPSVLQLRALQVRARHAAE